MTIPAGFADDDAMLGDVCSVWDDDPGLDGRGPHADPDPDAIAPMVAALAMAGRGGQVFPCHTPRRIGGCSCLRRACRDVGKHPRTQNGLTDATDDVTALRRWWGMWPTANVALRTGAVSGVVVLDIDADGFGAFEALCALHGHPSWCPDTWTVSTGGNGLHVYLRHPGPGTHIKTTAGVLALGVDVRADGGYAILPPSLHASGNRYQWSEGLAPWDVDLMEAPSWLLALLVDPPQPTRPTTTSATRVVGTSGPIPTGQRSATLTSLAGSMRRHGFGENSIAAALAVENAARCHPPLDIAEVAKIAASVARYAPEPEPAILVRGLRVREVRRA